MIDSVSVVIPVRNRANLIRSAVESVQLQTVPVQEILIVDDGSTDETVEVVRKLIEADARIKMIRLRQSGGASKARNIGVQESSGDWIGFLDSDDEWLPRKQEKQLALLEDNPLSVLSVTGLILRWPSHSQVSCPPKWVTAADLRALNVLGSTSSALVSRQAFMEVGGFDPSLPSCQDWDLWLRLAKHGDISVLVDPMVVFNQTETNRISKNRAAVLSGHEIFFKRALQDVNSRREIVSIKSSHNFRMAQIYLYDFQDFFKVMHYGLKSVIIKPNKLSIMLMFSAVKVTLRRWSERIGAKFPTP